MCARIQRVPLCVCPCSLCTCVCTCAVRVCTCVCACARPCLHVLWAPRGPDCAPPRHRGCRSAPSSAQTRPDRVCPTSPLTPPLLQASGRKFCSGDTLERASSVPGRDEAGVLGKVSSGAEAGARGREGWAGGRRVARGPSPRSEFCRRAQECNEVEVARAPTTGGPPATCPLHLLVRGARL